MSNYIRKYSSLCNKKRFFTRIDAKKTMKLIRKNHSKERKLPENIYYCEICSAYHLTSIKKSEWRGIKKSKP